MLFRVSAHLSTNQLAAGLRGDFGGLYAREPRPRAVGPGVQPHDAVGADEECHAGVRGRHADGPIHGQLAAHLDVLTQQGLVGGEVHRAVGGDAEVAPATAAAVFIEDGQTARREDASHLDLVGDQARHRRRLQGRLPGQQPGGVERQVARLAHHQLRAGAAEADDSDRTADYHHAADQHVLDGQPAGHGNDQLAQQPHLQPVEPYPDGHRPLGGEHPVDLHQFTLDDDVFAADHRQPPAIVDRENDA